MVNTTFGFKRESRIDISSSIMEYIKNRCDYESGMCYNNAFKCMTNNIRTYKDNRAYIGYVLSTDGKRKVAVRHSWNRIGKTLVDVTMFANNENPLSVFNFVYLPTAEYTSEEFLDAISHNNNLPCLPKSKIEYNYRFKLKSLGFEILE